MVFPKYGDQNEPRRQVGGPTMHFTPKKKQKKTPKGQRPINLSETPNYLQQTASKEKQEPNPTTK
jgi:hypothetical protein